MGAACVREADDHKLHRSGGDDKPRRSIAPQQHSDVKNSSLVTAVMLPPYTSLHRTETRQVTTSSPPSCPLSRQELHSALTEFHSASLLDIGRLASHHLSRYTRALPRRPSYLRNDATNDLVFPVASKNRGQTFLDGLLRSSAHAAQCSVKSPCCAADILVQYN